MKLRGSSDGLRVLIGRLPNVCGLPGHAAFGLAAGVVALAVALFFHLAGFNLPAVALLASTGVALALLRLAAGPIVVSSPAGAPMRRIVVGIALLVGMGALVFAAVSLVTLLDFAQQIAR